MVVTVQNVSDEVILAVKLRHELSSAMTVAHKNRIKHIRLRLFLLVVDFTLIRRCKNVEIEIKNVKNVKTWQKFKKLYEGSIKVTCMFTPMSNAHNVQDNLNYVM